MSDINSRVNTYLYTAQVLAEQAEENWNTAQRRVSIVGASLSLKQAWESWLEELASYLKIPASEIEDPSSEQALSLPDCQFLFSLKQNVGSWYQHVSALINNPLFFYEREFSQAQGEKSATLASRIDIIAIDTTNKEESTQGSLLNVIAELKAYIQHTREQQTEW